MIDFAFLANQCAPDVAPQTLERLIKVESSFNPYAIGVVGGRLARQPRHKEEAIATALYLELAGWNFSMGLGQVNRYNLDKYGLTYETVFDPCHNARAAAGIFNECLQRASGKFAGQQAQLAAFSCYYSGNFRRGFVPEGQAQTSYVERIMAVKPTLPTNTATAITVIPNGKTRPAVKPPSAEENKQTQSGAKISQLGNTTTMGVKTLRGD
ncbi:type IV secretion system protein VirB1 [Gibbsiella quercinecans]|uniref:Lytic transglycosylase n=1 Tax=Gibbsiella quercinecans TaxID=929813 RepID=A0A250AZK2_9GAMM|nr:lytic transglycosylase domain-containing protein [Gibbsiella quercinecans]ATA19281.1 lytic transglycosylase [Gibbsiella quercinecans]RLM11102.1 lytic transglycosylase [Gibbsiella quercinecans]TCT87814.1 type IV secretion system protein VirB1 [Gibbsiella quercinecans]